jgi:heme-degrading monooxygenase HmoA
MTTDRRDVMTEMITTGTWLVADGKQAAFLDAWAGFAAWASSKDGAGTLRLGRDSREPARFVSFGAWESPELVHAWKADVEFRERMAGVLQYVDEFVPSELDVIASATGGLRAVAAGAGTE